VLGLCESGIIKTCFENEDSFTYEIPYRQKGQDTNQLPFIESLGNVS